MSKNIIEIENRTTWDTQELKKLFNLVSKNEGYYPRRIIVYYSRTHRIGGKGTVGYGWVKIGLPNIVTIYNNKTKKEEKTNLKILKWGKITYTQPNRVDTMNIIQRIGQVYAHELGHNLRLRHKDMKRSNEINVDYLKGIKIHRSERSEKKKQKEQRKKLAPFKYDEYNVKIYKYPWKVTSVKKGEKIPGVGILFDKTIYGYWYTFIIYKNRKAVYKSGGRRFFKNSTQVKNEIKEIIKRRKKIWERYGKN